MTRPITASGKIKFPGISSSAFEHPTDAAALNALRKVPGVDRFLRLLFRIVHEKRSRLFFLASTVRVNERQFGGVYKSYLEALEILDIEDEPELFIAQTPVLNAFAYGLDRPFIVLNSSAIDTFTPEELQALIGHELGHIHSGHMLYKSVLFALLDIIRMGGFGFPLGLIGIRAFVIALFEWYRKSELTCDRAGLLVCQNLTDSVQVDMKLAGGRHTEKMDLDEFLKQGDEYENSGDILDSIYKLFNIAYASHPYSVVRVRELKKWHDQGNYKDILAGNYTRRESGKSFADQLKETAKEFQEDLKTSQDPLSKLGSEFGKIGENLFQAGGDFWEKIFGSNPSNKKESPPNSSDSNPKLPKDSDASENSSETSSNESSNDNDSDSSKKGWKSWDNQP